MLKKINNCIDHKYFRNFIIGIIVFNAVVLGVQTSKELDDSSHHLLSILDTSCLVIFIIEIALKMIVFRFSFFRNGWNVFDFIVVGISLMPSSSGLSILRSFRVFRVMRLVSAMPAMRRVVAGMLLAIPGVGSVGGLLAIVFYIGSVMTTTFFGEHFPEWFGTIGLSMYSLFQIMTLESWSMGIVRPVMKIYPYAWTFFVPFIVVTTFTVLNLFIGIIVDAMAAYKEQENKRKYGCKREQTLNNIARIESRLSSIEFAMKKSMRNQSAVNRKPRRIRKTG